MKRMCTAVAVFAVLGFVSGGCGEKTPVSSATPAPPPPDTQARMKAIENSGLPPEAKAMEMGRAARNAPAAR